MKAIPNRVDCEVIQFHGDNHSEVYDWLDALFSPSSLIVERVQRNKFDKSEKMEWEKVKVHCEGTDGREIIFRFVAEVNDYIVADMAKGTVKVMGPKEFAEEYTLLEG